MKVVGTESLELEGTEEGRNSWERERERERESVVHVCCMFGWIVLFVSQVIKLFGRQKHRDRRDSKREREKERDKKNRAGLWTWLQSFFLSFFLPLHSCAKLVAKENLQRSWQFILKTFFLPRNVAICFLGKFSQKFHSPWVLGTICFSS